MTPELWNRVRAALTTLEPLDPQRRAEELARLRRSDPEAATEVAGLLGQDETPPRRDRPAEAVRRDRDQKALPAIPGCDLSGEVKYGGMGAVYFGEDIALRRPVAVKVLREEFADDAEMVARFEAEAQVCAQLQHPGIVPVHQVGRLTDGRPFYVMKLVKGDTLGDLLKQRASPADNLIGFLGYFRQVCEAMAYAHAKEVLHRDLKPANIMVGAYGEVLLMDWGLTKLIGETSSTMPEPRSRKIRLAGTSGEQALTEVGAIVGTIAYMPPEQASGRVADVDARSDVFGLGAVLFTILTGYPPYLGLNEMLVLRQAMQGDLADADKRLAESAADAELQALTRKCLAPQKEDRPADAGVVARDIADYLARMEKRLHQTEVRAAEEQKRRLVERRARRLTMGLAAALVLLIVGGGSVAWFVQKQRLEREGEAALKRQQADGAVAPILAESRSRFEQAWAAPLGDVGKFREALAQTQKADDVARTGGASAEVQRQAANLVAEMRQQVDAAERDRKLLAALLEVRRPHEVPRFRRDEKGLAIPQPELSIEDQFQAAFRNWDATFDVDGGDIKELAERLRHRPPAVVRDVTAALDEWARERQQAKPMGQWQRLADLSALLDESNSGPDDLRALLTSGKLARERTLGMLAMALRPVPVPFDAGLLGHRARLERLAAEMDVAQAPVLRLMLLTVALFEAGDNRLGERQLREALRVRRPDARDAPLYQLMGRILATQGRWSEAVEWLAGARQWRPELGVFLAEALMKSDQLNDGLTLYTQLIADQPDNPELRYRYGLLLQEHERYKEAEAEFREVQHLKPGVADVYSALGLALENQDRKKEAEAQYRESIRLQPEAAVAHCRLGYNLEKQERINEAEAEYRESVRLKPDVLIAHFFLGMILEKQKRYTEAEPEFREAIRRVPEFPGSHLQLGNILTGLDRPKEAEAEYRAYLHAHPNQANAHSNLGFALSDQGRAKEAEAEFREAIRLQSDHPSAYFGLGIALAKQQRLKEAEEADRIAIRLDPNNAGKHSHLGSVLRRQERYQEAEAAQREAIRLDRTHAWAHYELGLSLNNQERVKEAEVEYREYLRLKPDDSAAYVNLGVVLRKQRRYQEAEEAYHHAIHLKPDDPDAHNSLGFALAEQGRYKEAEAEYRAAIRLKPDFDLAHLNLGLALEKQERYKEAETEAREVLRLKPENPDGYNNLGVALANQGHKKEAEVEYRTAIRLRPNFPLAHLNFASLLDDLGRPKEAEAEYREAIRLKPDYADAHYDLGLLLADQRRYKEAEAEYREAIRLRPDDAEAHNDRGAVLQKQGQVKEAEAEFREVIRLQPTLARGHSNLGAALEKQGRPKEAEAAYRSAIHIQPNYTRAHFNLADLLGSQSRHAEAEAEYREVIRLKSDYPNAHYNLGLELIEQRKYKEAEAAFHEAVRLQPNDPPTHFNLGITLDRQKRPKEAEAAYREAIRLKPDYAKAHFNLGSALEDQQRYKDAEAAYREVIRLQPDYPRVHSNLGFVLLKQRRYKDAEAEYREAVRRDPNDSNAHFNLGFALDAQDRYKEAEASFRQTIRVKPDYAKAHYNLGDVLRSLGRFADARDSFRRSSELGNAAAANEVRDCERLIELDRKLPALLAGEAEPANAAEALELATLCRKYKHLFTAASRFAAHALSADPKLADEGNRHHRYNAACCAVLAAAGQGEDAKRLPDKVRAMLRHRALIWLRADLTYEAKLAERDDTAVRQSVRKRMALWLEDSDLGSVRAPEAVSHLPEDERQAWRQLWQDVAALLKKVDKP